jgi:hypothetical protein
MPNGLSLQKKEMNGREGMTGPDQTILFAPKLKIWRERNERGGEIR